MVNIFTSITLVLLHVLKLFNGHYLTCGLQVLLVSSSRHPDKWIVPGGGMEPEEEPSVAAAREVCEEVGSVYICFILMWYNCSF